MNNSTSEQIKELKKQIILLENNTSNQYKEHIINVIKELKQEIILIENKIEELRIFYITNKGNYDYELATTFFKNLQDFFEKERIKNLADLPTTQDFTQEYFIRYYSKYSSRIIERYIYDCRQTNHPNTPEGMMSLKKEADKLFNLICNEEEDKLLFKMLMFENKLKYYENRLTRLNLECEKPEIKNIMDMFAVEY